MIRIIPFDKSTTNVDCDRNGHILHEATDPDYWWCSRCHKYFKRAIDIKVKPGKEVKDDKN